MLVFTLDKPTDLALEKDTYQLGALQLAICWFPYRHEPLYGHNGRLLLPFVKAVTGYIRPLMDKGQLNGALQVDVAEMLLSASRFSDSTWKQQSIGLAAEHLARWARQRQPLDASSIFKPDDLRSNAQLGELLLRQATAFIDQRMWGEALNVLNNCEFIETKDAYVKLLIHDAEDEWVTTEKFDLIHSRMMVGSFLDWPQFFKRAYEQLHPGGYIELQDVIGLDCDDETYPPSCPLAEWWALVKQAFAKTGRDIDAASQHKERLEKAGFVDVTVIEFKWPINTWPGDSDMKNIGMWSKENTLDALEALAMAPLTRTLEWEPEEVRMLLELAEADIENKGIHAYWNTGIFAWYMVRDQCDRGEVQIVTWTMYNICGEYF
ncbi:hypothetical protein VE03_10330 [Pseudogymnoascus sp. 23342-1-I1]|nr:hypothetical protein VE03_10330 [Pseudogymnoascus sp. 23342-1-I1]